MGLFYVEGYKGEGIIRNHLKFFAGLVNCLGGMVLAAEPFATGDILDHTLPASLRILGGVAAVAVGVNALRTCERYLTPEQEIAFYTEIEGLEREFWSPRLPLEYPGQTEVDRV